MLDLRSLRGASAKTLTLIFVLAGGLTTSCEKELKGPSGDGTGGGAGADPCGYQANCLTPEAAWQRYWAFEKGEGGGAGQGGEAGAGPVSDECPAHDGNGPLVSSPPTTSAASCCYDLGEQDRCD